MSISVNGCLSLLNPALTQRLLGVPPALLMTLRSSELLKMNEDTVLKI